MNDKSPKRRLEELQRAARVIDPMREARDLLDPMREAKELLDPMRGARDLLDPMREARELLDPMREAQDLLDPIRQAREQFEAARLEPVLRAREELDAFGRGSVYRARQQLEAAQMEMLSAQKQIAAMFRDPMEKFREQINEIIDPLAGFREAMDQGTIKLQQQLHEILDPLHGVRDWLKAYQEEQRGQFQHWRTLLDDFNRQIQEMPARLRAQLAVLMERGWCLDPEMPHAWGVDLVEAIADGEEEEAQQWLIGYFRKRLGEIEKALVERHPQRATIIAEAFSAHREGRYVLSIPVLLAQADGVIHDKHRRQLFSKKSSANLQEVLANLPDDDTRVIFMAAFYVDNPLTKSTQKLPANFDGLNRHAVLHGTDAKYGTEVNSLRAVSILNLASYCVTEGQDGEAAA